MKNVKQQRLNYLKGGLQVNLDAFDNKKATNSKSPSNHKLDSMSPQKKKLRKASSKLFEAAHFPATG
jgi:hypothetical protein